ncbi:MAG: hypothetical protein MRK02_05385 [Candidatus Scalindua sp.]|nr:hypothetical protein [Candidatus Scalindua sp.]
MNSARRLYEDLSVIAVSKTPAPGITYSRVETEKDLFGCINQLNNYVQQNGVLPLIHIDAHGCKDGIQLANNSQLSWSRLIDVLVPLNTTMKLNLMLILASCHGGTFAKAISITDRAPVWGLIGPTQALTAGQVEDDFGAFYKTFFYTLSTSKALEVLNRKVPKNVYFRTTVEDFFYEVWKGYKKNYCSPDKLKERANKMYKLTERQQGISLLNTEQFKQLLKSQDRNVFNNFRDTYFMCDLFPNHKERFGVTYDKAEVRVAR